MIKKIYIIAAFLLISTMSFSQKITVDAKGKYYDQNLVPYTGLYSEKWENGATKVEISLADGVENGATYLYFQSSQKQEQRWYKMGMKHGTWIIWNSRGVKTSEANYYNDKKHGKWFVWNDAGTLLYDMTYNNSKKTGLWVIYNAKGDTLAVKQY